jgi:hypothetical protein
MSPVYLEESTPPAENLNFWVESLNNKCTYPKLVLRSFVATGVSDRFEGDTKSIFGNRTIREKVLSNGRDSAWRCQETKYLSRMCEINARGTFEPKYQLTLVEVDWPNTKKKEVNNLISIQDTPNNLPYNAVDIEETRCLELVSETREFKESRTCNSHSQQHRLIALRWQDLQRW